MKTRIAVGSGPRVQKDRTSKNCAHLHIQLIIAPDSDPIKKPQCTTHCGFSDSAKSSFVRPGRIW